MPPIVTTVLAIFHLAVTAAPEIAKVYSKLREWFAMLFNGGIITAEQQEALMNWANEHQAKTLAGEVPPEFTVEPDPE